MLRLFANVFSNFSVVKMKGSVRQQPSVTKAYFAGCMHVVLANHVVSTQQHFNAIIVGRVAAKRKWTMDSRYKISICV